MRYIYTNFLNIIQDEDVAELVAISQGHRTCDRYPIQNVIDDTLLDNTESKIKQSAHSARKDTVIHLVSHLDRTYWWFPRLAKKSYQIRRMEICPGYRRHLMPRFSGVQCSDIFFISDCPRARDGVQLFSCPTPDRYGIYRCIDDHALCDNKPDCPNREDENKTVCMFHKMVSFGHMFC